MPRSPKEEHRGFVGRGGGVHRLAGTNNLRYTAVLLLYFKTTNEQTLTAVSAGCEPPFAETPRNRLLGHHTMRVKASLVSTFIKYYSRSSPTPLTCFGLLLWRSLRPGLPPCCCGLAALRLLPSQTPTSS